MANRARVVGIHPIAADEPVHLVELEFEGSADGFDFGEITQEVPGQPQRKWQAVYEEREVGQNRFAFFFHYLDTPKPLLSPTGLLALPPESPVPKHLQGIEYEPPWRRARCIDHGRRFPQTAGNKPAGRLAGNRWSGYNSRVEL